MQMEELENANPTTERCRNKWLKVALFTSVAVAVALSIVLALAGSRVISLHSEEYCLTAECAEAAAELFNKINWSADPCDNFYNFACGRWQEAVSIPEAYSIYSSSGQIENDISILLRELLETPIDTEKDIEVVQRAKRLFQSCMNETAIELEGSRPLLNLLKHPHQRWPVLEANNGPEGTWKEEEFDLLETLAVFRGKLADHILISIYVEVNIKTSSEHILQLKEGNLLMNILEDYLTNSTQAKLNRHALLQLMIDVPILLGANANTAKADMEAVMEFETKLAKILIQQNERSEDLYNKTSVLDLQNAIPQFDWLRYIRTVIDFEEHPSLTHINASEEVIVLALPYFKDLFQLLETVDNRTIANYIVWNSVYRTLGDLSWRFRHRRYEYLKVTSGKKSMLPRWKKCTYLVDSYMPYTVGRMFVKAHFQEDKKKLTEELIAGIRWAFLDILDKENDWLDAETKDKAKEKVQAVLAKIGYPDFILNDTIITNYRNVTILATDYFGNVLNLFHLLAQSGFRVLRLRTLKTGWYLHPTTVNAYHIPIKNQIQFPAGYLQKPFLWGKKYPLSISYGAMGTVIAHEFSHAFDNNGRKFDKDGNLNQWWTNDSISQFNARADCFVKQYNDYYWALAGLKVNGEKTLGENIADNSALHQSFRAYRKWIQEERGNREEELLPGLKLNHNQLFFLSFAQNLCSIFHPVAARNFILTQVHAPHEFRVTGSLRNFEEFSKAYNCPSTSPMNRGVNSCRLW